MVVREHEIGFGLIARTPVTRPQSPPSASPDPGEGTEIISLLEMETDAIFSSVRSTWDGAVAAPWGRRPTGTCSLERR